MIDFDPVTHEYRLEGVILPSVTQILSAEGFIDDTWFTEQARERGRIVHKATHLYDMDDLDEDTVDPVIALYLEAWKRFKGESGFVVEHSERQVWSTTYQYAGTLDRQGRFPKGRLPAIIDIKTGACNRWTGLQLAAYETALNEPHERYGVELRGDGTYKLMPFTDRTDRAVWLSAVSVHHWKKFNLHGGR